MLKLKKNSNIVKYLQNHLHKNLNKIKNHNKNKIFRTKPFKISTQINLFLSIFVNPYTYPLDNYSLQILYSNLNLSISNCLVTQPSNKRKIMHLQINSQCFTCYRKILCKIAIANVINRCRTLHKCRLFSKIRNSRAINFMTLLYRFRNNNQFSHSQFHKWLNIYLKQNIKVMKL
jgi:hypothetical protein